MTRVINALRAAHLPSAIYLLLLSMPAAAQLFLDVDMTIKTVAITGSETASIEGDMGEGTGIRVFGGDITSARQAIDLEGAITESTGGTLSAPGLAVGQAAGAGAIKFDFQLDPYDEGQSLTLTGTGTTFSYASLTAGNQAVLESAIGEQLVVGLFPDTFSPIEIRRPPAQTWTLVGWTFEDGGVATGSFVFNTDTSEYSDITITTTAGTL